MTDQQPTEPFSTFLAEYRYGELDTELAAELLNVVEAVATTGKQGTVTLTLKVARREGGGVEITEDVKAKAPVERESSIYYINAEGHLTRRDPRQPSLPFNPATGEITQ